MLNFSHCGLAKMLLMSATREDEDQVMKEHEQGEVGGVITAEKSFRPYTLLTLPEDIQDIIIQSFVLKNRDEYRAARSATGKKKTTGGVMNSLFSMVPVESKTVEAEVAVQAVKMAIQDYEDQGYTATDDVDKKLFEFIIPRAKKAKDVRQRRVKEKAEVFTPAWVCNKQNNLVDNYTVYPDAFNVDYEGSWTPSYSPIDFSKGRSLKSPDAYISSKRLEFTTGEAPYLVSPYDMVTGEEIPVRDEENRFARIGILDRKLRVVTENYDDKRTWIQKAKRAMKSTYGYEWQGDSILLARLNLLNTFVAYFYDRFGMDTPLDNDVLADVALIISQNIFQMDALKCIIPLSERSEKKKTKSSSRYAKYIDHDGTLPVITWHDGIWFPYEDHLRKL